MLNASYDPLLVTLSLVVAIVAAYAALNLAVRVIAARGRQHRLWLWAGAGAMGIGIWSMHFIGMLALRLPVAVSYDIVLTLCSLVIAVAVSVLALFLIDRTLPLRWPWFVGGVGVGLGIAAMHYTGMAAIRMAASVQYDGLLVAASIAIATIASLAALALAHRASQGARMRFMLVSAVILGAAIAGMHYTAMAAAAFTAAEPVSLVNPIALSPLDLAAAIGASTLLILGLLLISPDKRSNTLGIGSKLAMLASLLIIATAGILGAIAFDEIKQLLLRLERGAMSETVHVNATRVQATIDGLSNDARFLARTPPVTGIMRARDHGGVDPVERDTEEQWRSRLAAIFTHFLETKPDYVQARFIDLEQGAREIVRVERRLGHIAALPVLDLQDKSDRAYVQEARQLKAGEVYLSDITLNREHGRIVTPMQPMLRAAMPVFTADGHPFGLIVLNLDARSLLAMVAGSGGYGSYNYIVNDAGDFLFHADARKAFAFERGQPLRIQDIHPELAAAFAGGDDEFTGDVMLGRERLATHVLKLHFDPRQPQRYLGMVNMRSYAMFSEHSLPVLRKVVLYSQFLIAVAILLAFLFSRIITRPLQQITQATQCLAHGQFDVELPEQAGGEIGDLAYAFRTMSAQIRQHSRDLEESEERYRSLVDLSPEAIGVHDGETWQYINPAGVELFCAKDAEEIIGKPVQGFFFEKDSPAVTLRMRTVLEQRQSAPLAEYRLRCLDGHPIPAEIVGVPIVYDERPAVLLIMRDVTERKHTEERLKLSDQVINNVQEGIYITDANGIIRSLNPAFAAMTGYAAEELIGKRPSLFKSGHHHAEFYRNMWQALLGNGQWQGEVWNRRKDGEAFPAWQSITAITDEAGDVNHFVSIVSDISERKQAEQRLKHLALHDALTELPNRALFHDLLQQALAEAHREKQQLALLFLDLDRFKTINDTLGHPIGDLLLKETATRLRECVRESDIIARMGGDEFTVILRGVNDANVVGRVVKKIIARLRLPFTIQGHDCLVGASIGISLYPADGSDATTLIKHADTAMYRAKAQGKNQHQFFTRTMSDEILARLQLEKALHAALEREEFLLYYQPKVSLASGEVVGAEALLRWRHPQKGILTPDKFLPVAEETGLIVAIGAWVLRAACRQAKALEDGGLAAQSIAVNLSAKQFEHKRLVQEVAAALEESGLQAGLLDLEVTETCAMGNVGRSIEVLEALRRLGVRVSIDDFGSGYSSLSYLKRLPIDTLKIDRAFVRDTPGDADDVAITTAIISMARSLNLNVVAEGVETEAQLGLLKDRGCNEAQGALFAMPLAPDDYLCWLKEMRIYA